LQAWHSGDIEKVLYSIVSRELYTIWSVHLGRLQVRQYKADLLFDIYLAVDISIGNRPGMEPSKVLAVEQRRVEDRHCKRGDIYKRYSGDRRL
jgi:hypothetical protein